MLALVYVKLCVFTIYWIFIIFFFLLFYINQPQWNAEEDTHISTWNDWTMHSDHWKVLDLKLLTCRLDRGEKKLVASPSVGLAIVDKGM